MYHELKPEELGQHGEAMADAVSACVHCGFCLPTCPTFRELGQEMDSPRGRIILMKEVLEGRIEAKAALPHIDRCLGCLACEPACPSGVSYRDLISPFRARMDKEREPRKILERLRRKMILSTVPYPGRFALGAKVAKAFRPFVKLMPKTLQPFFELLPASLPRRGESLKDHYLVRGREPRARVALLKGCAQQVLSPRINEAAIEVLLANGIEVLVPEDQVCCGSLSWHVGDIDSAQKFARENLSAFSDLNLDAIVTTAAGCGSGMQEYGLILEGTNEEGAARELSKKVMDISAFLIQTGFDPKPPALAEPLVVAYHDACHLSNGQGVVSEPRSLLNAIGNVEIREISDREICCGSAGSYNLDQPEIAGELGRKKAQTVLDTGASVVVTGNIGCLMQLRHHLSKLAGDDVPEVKHTVEILAQAYRKQ